MNAMFRILLLVSLFAHCLDACGQVAPVTILVARADSLRKALPVEKLYLQLDKPRYVQHDTIWFKGYLFNADYLTPSIRSGILYLELDNDNNKLIKRIMVPVAHGLTWGNFVMDGNIPEGNYTLRAYTNCMRNFGEAYVFKKDIYIASPNDQTHLITANFEEEKQGNSDNIRAHILISSLDKKPARLLSVNMKVMAAKHNLTKAAVTTGIDGKLDVNFDLPANTDKKSLAIVLENGESETLTIPVQLKATGDIDLQFMPEGGTLVAGIPARIGFKAIGEDGFGVDVSGKVYNSKQREVASFRSEHKGIGSFELLPAAGETYSAKITMDDGTGKSYALPAISTFGTALRISNNKSGDTLQLRVWYVHIDSNATDFYLIGQARGVTCYAARLTLNGAKSILVPASLFPTGIARFSLLNASFQPLNERLYFIDHHDNLNINLTEGKNRYMPHDSIALGIKVTDKDGKPVHGSFSMAVTDDSQVKTDSTGGNIVNNLLLTSDLKGTVEDPAYYFNADTSNVVKQQLDNLMLTQGWVGYDWMTILNPPKQPLFASEREFMVKGKVANVFNSAVAGTHVMMFSKRPFFLIDTTTNKDGRFVFKNIAPIDTPVYILQARNRNGKSFNVNVQVDEVAPPLFTNKVERSVPWYVNTDTTLMTAARNSLVIKKENEKIAGSGHMLREVKISAKKFIKDSQNLNGPGNADQVIDEKDLEQAGKKTLLQLLEEKIPGFTVSLLKGYDFIVDGQEVQGYVPPQFWYSVNGKPVKFIIDGISFYQIMTVNFPLISEINSYLNAHTAEDIKGIEVNKSPKYDSKYIPMEWSQAIHPGDIAFVEITTRAGNGPGIGNTPGTYLYKPMAFTLPKKFYRPKYTVKDKATNVPDLRSTIHWEPNIIPDSAGSAAVSFYSADKPANYTITIEGTDQHGNVGFIRKRISVN